MKHYPLIRGKGSQAAKGLVLLILLLLCRDALAPTQYLGVETTQFLCMGFVTGLGVVFLYTNRGHWRELFRSPRLAVAAVCTGLLLLPMAVKGDFALMYLTVIFCIWVAVFFSYFLTLEEAAKLLVIFLTWLGVYSLLCNYLLRLLVERGILQVPTFVNGGGHLFHNLIFANITDTYVKNRNFGMFREPGAYQFFLILGLYLNNFEVSWSREGRRWAVNAILSVTMLSTFATGGIVELVLLWIILYFHKKLWRYPLGKLLPLALILLAALAGTAVVVLKDVPEYADIFQPWYDTLWEMTRKLFFKGGSFKSRRWAIEADLGYIAQFPLFGGPFMEVLMSVENNTTTTLLQYGAWGVFTGSVHVAGWLAFLWKKTRPVWVNLGCVVVMFLSFNTQNFTAELFFWLFPMLALCRLACEKGKKK